MEVSIAKDPWVIFIYGSPIGRQDTVKRESGVFPIILPRNILLSGLGYVVYFYHLQAG